MKSESGMKQMRESLSEENEEFPAYTKEAVIAVSSSLKETLVGNIDSENRSASD